MVKLTKVSIALALGLMISLLLFSSGVFAQSVNQSSASVAGRHGGCRFASCGERIGSVRCVNRVRLVKVWQVHRVVETFRTFKVFRTVVTVIRAGRVFHLVKLVKVWQTSHVVRAIRSLQESQRVFRACHAW